MQKLTQMFAVLAAFALAWSVPGAAADRQNGRTLYEMHCVGCHGESGNSIDPTIPNFANGDRLFQMDMVRRAARGRPNGATTRRSLATRRGRRRISARR